MNQVVIALTPSETSLVVSWAFEYDLKPDPPLEKADSLVKEMLHVTQEHTIPGMLASRD